MYNRNYEKTAELKRICKGGIERCVFVERVRRYLYLVKRDDCIFCIKIRFTGLSCYAHAEQIIVPYLISGPLQVTEWWVSETDHLF